jgi:hypothetical protein
MRRVCAPQRVAGFVRDLVSHERAG